MSEGSTGTGWGELLRGSHAPRALVVGGGMAMHAINVFIVITILPSVVRDIGGLSHFAWNTPQASRPSTDRPIPYRLPRRCSL